MMRSLRGPRAWFALALLAGTPAAAAAQAAVISGRVTTEQGQPLQGANVYITELSLSVGTNATGNYTLTVPAARVSNQSVMLRVRSVGFAPQSRQITIRAGNLADQNFTLRPDVTRLSEVVVTGVSAETEQIKVPFAVARVDSTQMPVAGASVAQQLQGKVAGASIVSASGRPGAAPAIVLRGPTSINASGRGQGPLYIVDGVLLNGATPDLNPADIENIEVVKGAAAASLYGARAGGGVINITTKTGKNAQEGVKFGGRIEYGVNDLARDFSVAKQSQIANDPTGQYYYATTGVGGSPSGRLIDLEAEAYRVNNVPSPAALAPQGFLNDGGIASNLGRYRLLNLFQANPWPKSYDQVEQATRPDVFQQANIDMRGKVDNTGFFASVGQLDQTGAFEYLEGFKRTTARLNLDQQLSDKLTVQMNTFYSVQREDTDAGRFFSLSRTPAFADQKARDDQGRLYIRHNVLNQGQQNENPMYGLENDHNNNRGTRFLGSAQARYEALDWLNFSADFAYDRGTSTGSFLQDRGYRDTIEATSALGFFSTAGGDSRSLNTSVGAVARPQLIENLGTTLSARFLYDAQTGFSLSGSGQNLAVPGLYTANAAIENFDIGSTTSEVRSMSYFGGLDFDYFDRYILNFSVRREGSSLFGAGNRWATFPRVAGAWIASQEPWWPVADALSLVKFRAAWGRAGQRPSRTAQYETFGISASGALQPGNLGNVNLKPEILTEIEVGTDMELFGRYGLSLTYAQSDADDQILLAPPPAASGFSNQWQNVGQLQNKTWEASLDIPLINRADLRWSTRLIYDRNRAIITRLDVPEYQTGDVQGGESMYWVREGERLGTIYGRSFVYNCSQLPGDFASQCGAGQAFQRNDEGYIVWVGQGNNPGMGITHNLWNASLNPADSPWATRAVWGMPILLRDSAGAPAQIALGNGSPDYHAALSSNFSWRKLTAFALFDGSFGRRVWNQGYQWSLGDYMTGTTDQAGASIESAKPIGYYWRAGPGLGGSVGTGGLYDILGPTSHSTEDASFIKLREVTLNYNVGPIAGQGNWTIGVVGRNLLTFTDYRGFDPEVGIGGGQLNSAALNAVDSFGFPNTRTFTLQLSTAF